MTREELLKCGLDADFVNWLVDFSYPGKEYETFSYLMINRMHLAYIDGKRYGYSEGYNTGYTTGRGECINEEYGL